jgi:beta-glucosidase
MKCSRRWYDANEVAPLYPFGHGLSYTSFGYADIKLVDRLPIFNSMATTTSVQFTVQNTGSVAGAEISQLYVSFPERAREPPRQLRGFAKTILSPGESKTVSINLSSQDVSIWNADSHQWEIVTGEYILSVGASSRDLRLSTTLLLK